MTALAGVDLHRLGAGGTDAVSVVGGLLIALDHRHLGLQLLDGLGQQGGLARTGAGDQINGENTPIGQPLAVGRGVLIIFPQDILLDLYHALLAHTRHVGMGRALAEVQIALGIRGVGMVMMRVAMVSSMGVMVPMTVILWMLVGVIMAMAMMVVMALDLSLALTTSANRTHICYLQERPRPAPKSKFQATSNSLTRISLPPVTCT